MAKFIISTESTSDLTYEFAKEHDIKIIPMSYYIDNVNYEGTKEDSLGGHEFFDRMREGSMPTTAMVSYLAAEAFFEPFLKEGLDILHIGFSSSLSGTCENIITASKNLKKKYPDRKVIVIDSRCASSGEGLLAYLTAKKRSEGASFDDTVKYGQDTVQKVIHYFTVNDLYHLHRGGRISKAKAVIGSLLGIKPVLHVDAEGRLVPLSNARGRKKALLALVEKFGERNKGRNDLIFINHGDCLEDAEFVVEEIKARYGFKNFVINYIGPVIGSHSGPGTVALFFTGEERTEKY